MSASDLAQIAAAVAAVAAVIVATLQVRGLREDAAAQRAGEILGVCVFTKVVHRPRGPEEGSDQSLWRYEFKVVNPGRFPITKVDVEIEFPLGVQRVHFDGSMDKASPRLEMMAPVVPSHGETAWQREVLVPHSEHHLLRDTEARVLFDTPDAGRVVTSWPATGVRRQSDARLQRALRRQQRS